MEEGTRVNRFMQANKKIETTVVGGYKTIEKTVVDGYKRIEARFVEAFLTPNEAAQEEEAGK